MKIVCGHCGRVTTLFKEPHHFVCNCGSILFYFGEQRDCELIKSNTPKTKRIIKNFMNRSLRDLSTPEKTQYFEEKYPLKQ